MSTQSSDNNKRIAKNTLLLYFRMLFMMVVSLYTSRVILNALGVEDFGIYNVVGGVVAMFSVISGSLSAAISRFITYELGKGNQSKLNGIFSASVTIQLLLSLKAQTFSHKPQSTHFSLSTSGYKKPSASGFIVIAS